MWVRARRYDRLDWSLRGWMEVVWLEREVQSGRQPLSKGTWGIGVVKVIVIAVGRKCRKPRNNRDIPTVRFASIDQTGTVPKHVSVVNS